MSSYVICSNSDGDPDDVVEYGPFRDAAWAYAWIKQHAHDPGTGLAGIEPGSEEWEEAVIKRSDEDYDHYCENMYIADGMHAVVNDIREPGFDPTTMPVV